MKVCVCRVKLIIVLQSIFPIISGHYLGGVGFEVNNYNQTSETKNYKSSFNKQRGAIKTSGSKYIISVSLTTVWSPGRCWKTRWCPDELFYQGNLIISSRKTETILI